LKPAHNKSNFVNPSQNTEVRQMKNHVRILSSALTIGAACCLAISNLAEIPAQDVNSGSQSETATLVQEFKTAEYFWQQAEVGEKLVALNDKSIEPAMLELLKSENRAVRCNAGRVLAGLGDDRGLFAVIAELKDKSPRPTRWESCSDCKTLFSPGQIRQDRYYAAHVLGKIGDKRAVPALIETLQDESLYYQAAIILGDLGDERAVPALLALLEQARDRSRNSYAPKTDMMLWAGYALMGLRHPEGLQTLVEFLNPEHNKVQRRHAVDALGKFGDRGAVPFLVEALNDEDVEVRVNAIMALGRIGDQVAVPALKESLKDTRQEKGHARQRYQPPMPLFKAMTVHEAALEALNQIEARIGQTLEIK
jgi:HEAT repeat protein